MGLQVLTQKVPSLAKPIHKFRAAERAGMLAANHEHSLKLLFVDLRYSRTLPLSRVCKP